MLEKAMGVPYERMLHDRLLGPFEMENSGLSLVGSSPMVRPGMRGTGLPSRPWSFDAYAPCGALVSTADDLIAALRHFLSPSDVMASSIDLSVRPYVAAEGRTLGLAWMLGPRSGWSWHNGATFGHSAYLAMDRARNIGVVVVANQALPQQITRLGHELMQSVVASA